MSHTITEYLGDGVGDELRAAVHELAESLPVDISFEAVDLSIKHRESAGRGLYDEAYESISRNGVALKYPTATEKESPNAVLRKMCDFTVIHRPVWTVPGVTSNFKKTLNLDIVRMATGGTYSDPGQKIGKEVAVSLRVVERITARSAARYAFELGRRLGARVTSSSKWTIQRATDGLFEDIVADMAKEYPDVPHNQVLFDALLAKTVMQPEQFRVVITPNEYGDFLSDMACGLVGSLGIGASGSFSFDEPGAVKLAMFDATHGTAPDIAGKNMVNPIAILLAFANLLGHLGYEDILAAIRESVSEMTAKGHMTGDLGGSLSTTEFTRQLRDRVSERLGY